MHRISHYNSTQRRMGALMVGAVLLLQAVPVPFSYAQGQTPEREYQIKASFLYRFLQFVEWPDDAFAAQPQHLVVGILGDDPFGAVLDHTLAGKTIGGKTLIVERYAALEDVKNCHMLFVSASLEDRLPDVFQSLKTHPILTVGESARFTQQGGTIKLFEFKNKVRFEINLEGAQRARLKVSSKLLKLARVV